MSCFRSDADHDALPWNYCDQEGCGWDRPAPPKPKTLAELQVEAILVYCDDAERIYHDAGFVVPGLRDSAALISTEGVRSTLLHVENVFKRGEATK